VSYRRTRKPIFKACKKCGGLVPLDAKSCPYCGSTSFTEDWEGMIIIIDPGKSLVAKMINRSDKPGVYAIKVGGKVVLK
jgi:DNA-directed RNA polymerase subunit E"